MDDFDDLDILREMINAPPLSIPGNNGVIELVESEYGNNYTVTIRDAPDNCIVIKADNFELLVLEHEFNAKQKILSGKNESRKKSDYIIVCDDDGKKRIFYIELKNSDSGYGRKIRNQLRGSKCFMEYFRAIGREFWDEDFLKDYEARYIGFTNLPIKSGGAEKDYRKGDSPDNFFAFKKCNDLNFKQLLKLSCEKEKR